MRLTVFTAYYHLHVFALSPRGIHQRSEKVHVKGKRGTKGGRIFAMFLRIHEATFRESITIDQRTCPFSPYTLKKSVFASRLRSSNFVAINQEFVRCFSVFPFAIRDEAPIVVFNSSVPFSFFLRRFFRIFDFTHGSAVF